MSGINNDYRSRLPPPPPTRDGWWVGEGYGARDATSNYTNGVREMNFRPPLRVVFNGSGVSLEPWVPTGGRNVAGPLSGLPSYLLPILHDVMALDIISSSSLSIPEPFMGEDDVPRLTLDEQKEALAKLKKEIYNPVPKRLTKRLSLYYRENNSRNSFSHNQRESEGEDGKRCAICLDDFEVKQVVTVTPCSHMFHEECIVPWVKSQGQCPVCRFSICNRMRQSGMPA